ncbi:MAG TPA: nuclear transport factor 2 family protein [Terriglobales bacterium]
MACNIITQFRTKPGRADDLIELIRKNLSESAHHSGCVKISIQQNQDDPNDVISNQSWETRKHYESYFAWRAEEGLAAEIQSLCAEPVSMRFFDEAAAATPSKPASDTKCKDKETLVSIVKEMTESMTGAQSTRHWAEDALWFDIPPFASRGVQPALKFFDRVFGSFQSCKVDILEMDVVVNGDMGLVCTIQRVSVVLKTGDAKRLVVRETDCFERRNGEWKLTHQHASVPAGGDWDGKVTTA